MARQFREQLEEEVNLEEARKAQPAAHTPPPPVTAPPVALAPTAEAPAPQVPSPAALTDTPAPLAPATEAQPSAAPVPPPEPEQQIVYPDTYSHAHPTDSLGRPVAAPTSEPPAVAPGQHDWVGGVTSTDKPAQPTADAAYAPPNERGT